MTESSTTILRRMLDERGVWWHDTKIGKGFITVYEHDGITWIVTEHSSGRLSVKGCVKPTQGHYDGMTPEQAIAATLGQAVRHPKPHEKWTTVLLPEIAWSWDDSWPDYLSVAHDTYGEWRTYVPEATLGAGTCEADETDRIECVETVGGRHYDIHIMECTECGHTYEHVNGDYEFCPRCGRKRRDVEE